MRKDAEAHAAEDEKRKEEIDERNQADSAVYQTEKALKDAGDKIAADKKAPVEKALEELKEALKGGDSAAIKAKREALMQAVQVIGQELYAHSQSAQGAQGAQPGAGTPPPPQGDASSKKKDDDVIDGDFTMNN